MPYLRQCTPPEFSATLPPMVQAICDDGSGVIEAGLLDRLRHREIGDAGLDHGDAIVEVDLADALELGHADSTPSPSGSAPPDSEVPAPRGTTLMPSRWQ